MPIQVTVYTPADSPRLRYVLDWLLGECFELSYRITHQEEDASAATHLITYGSSAAGVSIPNAALLFETGINEVVISSKKDDDNYYLFPVTEGNYSLPFDLL